MFQMRQLTGRAPLRDPAFRPPDPAQHCDPSHCCPNILAWGPFLVCSGWFHPISFPWMHTCACIYLYAHTCLYKHTRAHLYMHLCAHICPPRTYTYICTCKHLHTCTAYTHTHTLLYVHTSVHTYICTHAQQIRSPPPHPDLMMCTRSCFAFEVLVKAVLPCECSHDDKCLPFLAFTIPVSPILSLTGD